MKRQTQTKLSSEVLSVKRALSILVAGLMTLALASCGKDAFHLELSSGYALQVLQDGGRVSLARAQGDGALEIVEHPVVAYIDHAEYLAVIREISSSTEELEPGQERWEYYVVPLQETVSDNPVENVLGPLSRDAFVELLKERRLPIATEFEFIS